MTEHDARAGADSGGSGPADPPAESAPTADPLAPAPVYPAAGRTSTVEAPPVPTNARPATPEPATTPPSGAPPHPDVAVPAAPGGWGNSWQGPAGYPSAQPPAAPWLPPAFQPGIIPLRPLNLGEILDGSFRAIRANPKVMFGLTAMVVSVATLVAAVVQWYLGPLIAEEVAVALADAGLGGLATEPMVYDTLGSSAAGLVAQPVLALATTVLNGLLIVAVSRSVLNRTATIGEVLRQRRVWLVVGFTLLLAVASWLAAAVVLAPALWLLSADQPGPAAAFLLLGSVALLVVGCWVAIRTLLVPAALMLEGRRAWPTVSRAWRLTRGSWWRLFGITILVGLIAAVAQWIVAVPFGIVAPLVFPDPLSIGSIAVYSVGTVVSYTLTTVFSSAAIALLYIDVRMRREGLDVELARAAGVAP